MKLVIDIDEDVKKAFDCAESNDLKGCYYDHGGVIGNAIKRGTPLPKGHKIIDEYALQEGLALIPVEDRTFRKAVEFIEQFPEVFDTDKEGCRCRS